MISVEFSFREDCRICFQAPVLSSGYCVCLGSWFPKAPSFVFWYPFESNSNMYMRGVQFKGRASFISSLPNAFFITPSRFYSKIFICYPHCPVNP